MLEGMVEESSRWAALALQGPGVILKPPTPLIFNIAFLPLLPTSFLTLDGSRHWWAKVGGW